MEIYDININQFLNHFLVVKVLKVAWTQHWIPKDKLQCSYSYNNLKTGPIVNM